MEVKTYRQPSEASIYHVFSRGVGKQIIFEDDVDRKAFLQLLESELQCNDVKLLAWCLMDNHFHLLLIGDLKEVASLMKSVLAPYAKRFNRRHGREGHVFQSRFGSEPIKSGVQLLQAVRYIHQNPEKAYLAPTDRYRWSSYQEYVHRAPKITSIAGILEEFGTVGAFVRFHQHDSDFSLVEYDDRRGEVVAKHALQTALDELGEEKLHSVRALPRQERAECVVRLKGRGLSNRQIERLTGVSRNTIASISA